MKKRVRQQSPSSNAYPTGYVVRPGSYVGFAR